MLDISIIFRFYGVLCGVDACIIVFVILNVGQHPQQICFANICDKPTAIRIIMNNVGSIYISIFYKSILVCRS